MIKQVRVVYLLALAGLVVLGTWLEPGWWLALIIGVVVMTPVAVADIRTSGRGWRAWRRTQ